MTETERLRRSFLYTPGDDREMMHTALDSDADAVVFDLEDAVPNAAVPNARDQITAVLDESSVDDIEVCIRINGYTTELWLDDLLAAVQAGADTVVFPKVETVETLASVAAVVMAADGSPRTVELLPTIETPRGLFAADDIATWATDVETVTGLTFGLGDYTRMIGATGTPDSTRAFVSNTVLAAAAAGRLEPIYAAYLDHEDLDGLRRVAEMACEMGYLGGKAIHPRQIDVLNEVFTPDDEAVERARCLVEAYEATDRNAITVNGVFLDEATIEQYRALLKRHRTVR